MQTVWLKIRPTGVELIRLIFKFHILYEACYDFFFHAAHVIVSALKLARHPFRLDLSILYKHNIENINYLKLALETLIITHFT